jgi:hypothetical protein
MSRIRSDFLQHPIAGESHALISVNRGAVAWLLALGLGPACTAEFRGQWHQKSTDKERPTDGDVGVEGYLTDADRVHTTTDGDMRRVRGDAGAVAAVNGPPNQVPVGIWSVVAVPVPTSDGAIMIDAPSAACLRANADGSFEALVSNGNGGTVVVTAGIACNGKTATMRRRQGGGLSAAAATASGAFVDAFADGPTVTFAAYGQVDTCDEYDSIPGARVAAVKAPLAGSKQIKDEPCAPTHLATSEARKVGGCRAPFTDATGVAVPNATVTLWFYSGSSAAFTVEKVKQQCARYWKPHEFVQP